MKTPAITTWLRPNSATPTRSCWTDAFAHPLVAIERGATWTTDAPFCETPEAIAAMKAKGLLVVEMEAAALYAFSEARRRPVLCFAHVTNQMALVEGDFEKGEAGGTFDALAVIVAAARAWIGSERVCLVALAPHIAPASRRS
jgi:Phosphorylase superfamily